MDGINKIRSEIAGDWIPDIYSESIRPLRTRSFEMDIPERENRPEIFETLLGMELKAAVGDSHVLTQIRHVICMYLPVWDAVILRFLMTLRYLAGLRPGLKMLGTRHSMYWKDAL